MHYIIIGLAALFAVGVCYHSFKNPLSPEDQAEVDRELTTY